MAENQVPDVLPNPNTTVQTARSLVGANFGAAVVEEVTGSPNEINQMIVQKQSPTPQAKLTAGEVMHLYVAGTGGGGTKTVTPPGGSSAKQVIIVQAIIIIVLVIYCFVLGN
jgi:hypothetical protein